MRYQVFGAYAIDGCRGVLIHSGAIAPLTPRVFTLLSVLVEHRGRVLEKDELLRLVWHDAIVEENNLPRSISMLRKALHERPGQRDFIATIPGVGYRFVAEVHETDELPEGLRLTQPAETPPSLDGRASTVDSLHADQEAGAPPLRVDPRGSVASFLGARFVWMLPTVLGALVLALAGWGAWPAHPAPSGAPRGLWQFTSGTGIQHEPAWSPDNNAIAYASDSDGNFDVWVQGLSEPPVRITTSSEYDGQPAWSPDAQWIVFRSERDGGGLFVVSAHGGPERRLTTFGFTPQWSPAGDNILFLASPPDTAASLRLYVVESMGGTPRVVRTSDDLTLLSAAWHPDGRRISILANARGTGLVFRTQSIDGRDVIQSPIASDVRDRLALADLTVSHFSWAANGRFLYLDGMSREVRNLWRVGVEPETLAWTTGPDRLTTGAGADGEISPSPDGSRLAFSVNVGHPVLWSFPFDPVNGRILGSGEPAAAAAERGGDVQRTGGRLVYRAVRGALDELWEHSPQGERLLLADAHASLSNPRWSPDGQRVVFVRRRQGTAGTARDASLAMLAVSGGREQALTAPSSAMLIPTEWSSDGAWILSSCPSREFRTAAICLLPVAAAPHAERELRLVSARAGFDLYQQRFSPDERWISFMAVPRDDRSTSAIYVMPRDGGTWVPITNGHAYDDKPRWSPDGRTLYFISNRDGHFNVWARRFDGRGSPIGEVFRVTAFSRSNRRLAPHLRELDMAVLPDRMLLPMDESSSQVWILERADR